VTYRSNSHGAIPEIRRTFAKVKESAQKSKIVSLFNESLREFGADNGTLLASSISFNLLLSLFPLALAVVYIAGSFAESPYTQEQIIQGIGYLLPVSRQLIAGTITGVASARGAIGIIALIGLIWGGFGFFNSIRRALNAAWGIRQPHPLLKGQLINLSMMVGAAILLFLSVLITVFLSTVAEQSIYVPGAQIVSSSLLERILANVLAICLAFVVFLLLYKFIPSIRPRWKDIWPGALAAAISFEITKVIFLVYLRTFNPYNLVYGSIGALIAFLIWTYLSALIFLFIAKVTHVNLEMKNRLKT
jgi:membrane protein